MKSFFLQLLQYTHHFNQQLFYEFIQNKDKVSERCLQLFNHMLNAHQIWNNRMQPEERLYGVWEIHSLESLTELDERNYEKSVRITNEFSLDTIIHYTNSKGQQFSNTAGDIIYHIVNHATYHRGQIAVQFREAGIKPMISDYIFYKR